MDFQRTWCIVTSVFYELQPFRVIDVIDLGKYLCVAFKDIGTASVTLSDFLYQSTFYWLTSLTRTTWCLVILWLSAFAAMNYLEFGSLWILMTLFASIFLNLGKRKPGEMSAYSVFNEGFKQLLGTMNAEQFENEIRHRAFQREDIRGDGFVPFDDAFDEEFDSEEEAFPAQRHRRPQNNRQNRHQRRVQQLAAAAMANNEANHPGEPNNNDNNNKNIAPAVRRKGKKGRRTYEERLLRRENENLQRRQREENMGREFEFDSDESDAD